MSSNLSALRALSAIVAAVGPIPTVRVSSAQARGGAKGYAYWGAARGEIRARKRDGVLTVVSVEQASSDRRSERLAERDADAIAEREGRHYVQRLGVLSESDAALVLSAVLAAVEQAA
jgi:hypothetical protein